MAVTAAIFGNALIHLADADIDFTADTMKTSLHTSTFTPDQDANDFHDDATNELSTAGGYTAGGATLANPTRTYTTGTNVMKLDADDVAWTTASFTARVAVVYKDRGGAASADELLSYVNFGGDETVASGTFTIQWAAAGIVTLTAGAEA